MATATVAGRTVVATGKRTVVSPATAVVVNTAPGYAGRASPNAPHYSLHDCALASQAGLHNCVWPINLASADGVTFNNGIVLHTANGETLGSFTVSYT